MFFYKFSISLWNLLLDRLKHDFAPLEWSNFSREFDWYQFRWIWTDGMHVHALQTPGTPASRQAGRPASKPAFLMYIYIFRYNIYICINIYIYLFIFIQYVLYIYIYIHISEWGGWCPERLISSLGVEANGVVRVGMFVVSVVSVSVLCKSARPTSQTQMRHLMQGPARSAMRLYCCKAVAKAVWGNSGIQCTRPWHSRFSSTISLYTKRDPSQCT